jgi:hypothetical protein
MVVAGWYFNIGGLLLDLGTPNLNIILLAMVSISKDPPIFGNAT